MTESASSPSPSTDYINTNIGFFVRGDNPGAVVLGCLGWVGLHTGVTFGIYKLLTFARRHEQFQRAFEAVHLTPNWDWLASSAAAGLTTVVPLYQFAVRRDLDGVHYALNKRITELTAILCSQEPHEEVKDLRKEVEELGKDNAVLEARLEDREKQIAKLESRLEPFDNRMKESVRFYDSHPSTPVEGSEKR